MGKCSPLPIRRLKIITRKSEIASSPSVVISVWGDSPHPIGRCSPVTLTLPLPRSTAPGFPRAVSTSPELFRYPQSCFDIPRAVSVSPEPFRYPQSRFGIPRAVSASPEPFRYPQSRFGIPRAGWPLLRVAGISFQSTPGLRLGGAARRAAQSLAHGLPSVFRSPSPSVTQY